MLQNVGISGEENRRRAPDDLPERKVPWHDGEYHAERFVADFGRRPSGELRAFGLEHRRAVFGVVAAALRALDDLGFRGLERFSHFARHDRGIFVDAGFEDGGSMAKHAGARGDEIVGLVQEGFQVGAVRISKAGVDRCVRSLRVGIVDFTRRRISGS